MRNSFGNEEEITDSVVFASNPIFTWLKADFSLTNQRIIGHHPTTFLGVIPFGKNEISFPLKNISSIGVSTSFHTSKFIFGLFFFILGLIMFDTSILFGLLFLVLGIVPLLNSIKTSFIVTNNAGQPLGFEISILEKKKVEQFVNKVMSGISNENLRNY